MRFALIANSQATAIGVAYEESYPCLLKSRLEAKGHDLVAFAMSGWSVREFNANLESVLLVRPSVVIIQLGIIECARRVLSNEEKAVLRHIPFSRHLTKFLHDRRKSVIVWRNRLGINARFMGVRVFEREFERLCSTIAGRDIFSLVVEVPYFSSAYEKEYYPFLNEDNEMFNRVMRKRKAVQIIPSQGTPEGIWQPGTVHFNRAGHCLFAEGLFGEIERRVLSRTDAAVEPNAKR